MTSAATLVLRHEASPPQPGRGPDFEVVRTDGALLRIAAVSERARRAVPLLLSQGGCPNDMIVGDHRTSNELLYRLRQNGFRILYYGPAGPIEI
ncbi:hypothetical protein [Microvirga thermotolerans]|uniref:Uncharacterized protein n=1 Tax=Microvirga thermotolerans TaxID=2651334 RepID=A0A5P9JWC1_9HYPH|nr:hypothetical protein [Microvirga thermotolerans]QFU16519.1 hypothetical protein GDR74_09925 [Microvirga thermotolerans]